VASWRAGSRRYLATWPLGTVLDEVVSRAVSEAGLQAVEMPDGLRVRRTAKYTFVFNYSSHKVAIPEAIAGTPITGSRELAPASFAVFPAD